MVHAGLSRPAGLRRHRDFPVRRLDAVDAAGDDGVLARGAQLGDPEDGADRAAGVSGLRVLPLGYAAMAGVNLAFGVLGVNFEWQDPRRMVRGTVGCLSPIASIAALGICLVFFVGPVFGAPLLGLPAAAGRVVGLALGTEIGRASCRE